MAIDKTFRFEASQAKDIAETDRAYFAGLLDGEGSIMLHASSQGHYKPQVNLSNNSRLMIDWIQSKFGGSPTIRMPSSSMTAKHAAGCVSLGWYRCSEIEAILSFALPYLITKKHEAILLLEFVQMTKGPGGATSYTDEQDYRRAEICILLKQLKKVRS